MVIACIEISSTDNKKNLYSFAIWCQTGRLIPLKPRSNESETFPAKLSHPLAQPVKTPGNQSSAKLD